MKNILKLLLVLLLASCSTEIVPIAAISFEENEQILEQRETNRLVSKSIWSEHPVGSFAHDLKHDMFKYVTEKGDTLQYFFINNHLSGITIDIISKTIDEVINYYDSNPSAKKIQEKQYLIGRKYILIGEKECKKTPYVTVLNNANNEVQDMLDMWGQDYPYNRESADGLYTAFLLSKIGHLTGEFLSANLCGIKQPVNKYYNHLLEAVATNMAELEMRDILTHRK